MHRTLVMILAVALWMLPAAGADDPSPCAAPGRSDAKNPIPAAPARDGRVGGETIDDALLIDGLPFSDTGATCDNIDDYDEICPYDESTAPDVVYAFTPDETGMVRIDLCGSAYDTKAYVYEFAGGFGYGNPYACNDDANCAENAYASRLDYVEVAAGTTYYIVVDGYGTSCGEYALAIDWFEPCVLSCPPGGLPEGEPPIVDGYIDVYNDGCCGGNGDNFQALNGDENNELILCARTGTYLYSGYYYRDTDWYTLYKASDPFNVTCTAERETYVFQLGFDPELRCMGDFHVDYTMLVEPCQEGTLDLVAEIGDEVWLWASTTEWEECPEYSYILHIRGLGIADFQDVEELPPAVEAETTWSSVKRLFRP